MIASLNSKKESVLKVNILFEKRTLYNRNNSRKEQFEF